MGAGVEWIVLCFRLFLRKHLGQTRTNCIAIFYAHYFICSARFISMNLFVFLKIFFEAKTIFSAILSSK